MRRFLPKIAGLFLALAFVLPAQAQPPDKSFPVSTIEAKVALQTSLKAIGYLPIDAIDNRATLEKLAAELGKTYSDVPALEEIKHVLFLMAAGPGLNPPLDVADPDHAPLKLNEPGTLKAGFARQVLRSTNPDLQRVRKQTWPPDLTHGEKIALQAYSANHVYPIVNKELRSKGNVPPMYALIHERLQSAFRKAQVFDPPLRVSRGINIDNKTVLDDFLKGLQQAQKDGKPYVMAAYSSTSVGSTFIFSGNVHFHVNAIHGLDVYPVSFYPEEREFLINHNTSFMVKDVKMEGGRWNVFLDQLPPKATADSVDDKKSACLPFPDRLLELAAAA